MSNKILIFGHRGAKGFAPENTLESFMLAKNMGVDGVELDVHLSKDGALVVIHDDFVDRTTNGTGKVKEMTLPELKQLDAGIKFGEKWKDSKIPTLEEVFLKLKRIRYKIEIKHGSNVYEGIERKVLDAIERAGVKDLTRITSFDYDALRNMRSYDTNIEIGIIIHGRVSWFLDIAKRLNANWIQANFSLLDSRDVKYAHKEKFKIGVWGIYRNTEVVDSIKMGVDDLTLDRPDIAIKILRQIR